MDVKSIRQTEAAECGLACLAIASGMLGAETDLATLRRKHPASSRGLTLQDLMNIAAAIGLSSRPLRCDLEALCDVTVPAVLHWGLNHFVVLRKATRSHIVVQDPASGIVRLSLADASKKFTGVVLELSPAPAFQRRKERSKLKLSSLFRWTPVTTSGLVQVFLLSLLLQAYVVASPLYMQLAIDEAALKGDRELLLSLAVGFGLFGLFNVGATALRAVALQQLSSLIGWDMTGRLFHHMLRLPLPWFQRRKLADALSRFESIEPVRQLFANGLVASLIDGMLTIVTVLMMFILQWKLAVVAVLGVAAYVVIRLASVPLNIRLAGEALVATIAENGKRIETLRAIQTIKVLGAESQREGDWSNRFADMIRTGQKNAFVNIGFSSLQGLTDTLTGVAIIYLGASAVIDNTMTVGVLYAFMSYRGQFASRSQELFNTFFNWRMLDLHSDRIADIALTPVEEGIDDAGGGLNEMRGGVEVSGVAFRYSPHEPVVFQGVSVKIQPGEFVAIVGPSGAGKSTLVKVICGLYPVAAGEVRIDGMSLASWGPRTVRRNLGVVLQDDELMSGSIAENVAFFSETIDMPWVWECLRLASLDEEIRAMPMRAETLIGDMGSALSGGQKQRLLLARALYRRPKILILDEATSHLDVGRERIINEALKAQTITRIVVAHRPETIAAADRIFNLNNGRLVELTPMRTEAISAAKERKP